MRSYAYEKIADREVDGKSPMFGTGVGVVCPACHMTQPRDSGHRQLSFFILVSNCAAAVQIISGQWSLVIM